MGEIYEGRGNCNDVEFNVSDRPDGKADIIISGVIDYGTLKKLVMLLSPKKVIRW